MRSGHLAIFVLTAWGVVAARAQPSVALSVSGEQAYVGEALIATIEIADFTACEPPLFPALVDCAVRPLGRTRQGVSIINGVRTNSETYAFELTPQRAGRLAIPAIRVQVDGAELATQPVTLRVVSDDGPELLRVEISASATRVYVGQRVRAKMAIWLKPALLGTRPLTGQQMFQFIDRQGFGPFPLPQSFREQRWNAADKASPNYYVYESTAEVVPSAPGELNFPDVLIQVGYPTGFERDIFGSWSRTGERRLRATPRLDRIEVLPLPQENRPETFTGAVGQFQISAAATPTTVRIGDPIDLSIEIRGDGELETLPPPNLAANRALTTAFRVPAEQLAGETRDNRRRFTQTIRAISPDVREIPPIEYGYFDPQRGEYRVALSAAIPLRVTGADVVNASELIGAAPPAAAEPAPTGPLDGLRGNESDARRLLAHTAQPSTQAIATAVLVPPMLFLGLLGWQRYAQARGGDAARSRRSGALRTALRQLGAAGDAPRDVATAVGAALAAYLADRLNQPPARFVGRDGLALLQARGCDAELCERWSQLLDRCEQIGFGGGAAEDAATLRHDASRCLQALERLRL